MIFFFKQKTGYEMRISDWSSDVCSSDLKPGIEQIDMVEKAFCTNQLRRSITRRLRADFQIIDRKTADRLHAVADIGPESLDIGGPGETSRHPHNRNAIHFRAHFTIPERLAARARASRIDRKSTRLNSSH